ncbi:MAG: hypothetical protein EXR49_05465 [Dehalococcoidia bacterium]|nr:hypothetical protein [Dehalococcoidia bacterium]
MNVAQFTDRSLGRLVKIAGGQSTFVPAPMPRAVTLSPRLVFLLDDASRAFATLAGAGETIPNPALLIQPFLRKEAVLSSRVEGTQASLADLFRYEASKPRRPRGDVAEVANYIAAFNHCQQLLAELPLSLRFFNQVHGVLLQGVRGEEMRPGELREEQVHIGPAESPIEDARYVPPPAPYLRDLMDASPSR